LVNYKRGSPKVNALASALGDDYASKMGWLRVAELAKSRILSSIAATSILLIAFLFTGRFDVLFRLFASMVFPLFCIWYADAMGNLTGISLGLTRPRITDRTPGIAIAMGGWLLLMTTLGITIYHMSVRLAVPEQHKTSDSRSERIGS